MEELKEEMDRLRERLELVEQDHLDKFIKISEDHLEALKLQANSLSIPLLKEILVPVLMKLFSFFAVLVLALLAGIFGLRWALGDILKVLPS